MCTHLILMLVDTQQFYDHLGPTAGQNLLANLSPELLGAYPSTVTYLETLYHHLRVSQPFRWLNAWTFNTWPQHLLVFPQVSREREALWKLKPCEL